MYNLTMLLAIIEIVFTIISIKKKYFSHPSFIFAHVVYELAIKRSHFNSHITKSRLAMCKTVFHTVAMTIIQSTSQLRK